ncbi:hypothetical protein AURDEDRAFT_176187 [Auricularia subglabra TFB-10046 SS5]|uniref:Peptidase A1 domain-containing protein n=1 Tax=Auricularia subglabra (strain TFB-10046 / SS5) TaxID=717982 RepID=J0WQE6_AURST|nr:hypothetical protein AURDEDRAFT_176187 [Auricularia subglabra TFB-10046 SS5]
MSGYIVAPLTLQRPPNDPVRHALMSDTLRWNIKLTKLTKDTRPGFYMYKGSLHEVVFEPISPPPKQAQKARLASHPPRSRQKPSNQTATRSWGDPISFSANEPRPDDFLPQSTFLQVSVASTLVLRPVTDAHRFPLAYTIDMRFGSLLGDEITWQCSSPPAVPLIFRVMLDTAGLGHMWTYCTEGNVYAIVPTGNNSTRQEALTADQRTSLGAKTKISYNKNNSGRAQFRNAGGDIIDIQPVMPDMTGIVNMNNYTVPIPKYKFGAAIGFTPQTLDHPFDGIVGLGRSYGSPHALRGGTTLVQKMYTAGVIQSENFYICCRYEADPGYGDGFVVFGAWPSDFAITPVWQSVDIARGSANGKWDLHLSSIAIIAPGLPPITPAATECKVRIDNGTSQTILKNDVVEYLSEALQKIAAAHGRLGIDITDDVLVELVFESARPAGLFTEVKDKVSVIGKARNFFTIPNPYPNTPPVLALTGRPSGNDHLPYMLSINFFRTFLVGFRDTALTSG